jgi:hypothetical protein
MSVKVQNEDHLFIGNNQFVGGSLGGSALQLYANVLQRLSFLEELAEGEELTSNILHPQTAAIQVPTM